MTSYRYQALAGNGRTVSGVIEAEDRKSALRLLGDQGLFPSELAVDAGGNGATAAPVVKRESSGGGIRIGAPIKRKEVTAFTREMATLLRAAIPIPQALESLGEEEENAALREMINQIADSVKHGSSFSAALEEHPQVFTKLYASMVRVGEEAGALDKVLTDLADLLEHEDEVRSEVSAAIAYPAFVLGFGIFTVIVLLAVVLPKLFVMFEEMTDILPLPTRILLWVSDFLGASWWWLIPAIGGIIYGIYRYLNTTEGAENWDQLKLRLPVLGSVFYASALSRFSRTLGTLLKAGVSLLPALKIVEDTIGNIVLSRVIEQVSEETRGGDSLAAPLRKLQVFPRTVIQMISVGEETGKLDDMLLQVAHIEERRMRAHTKTLISLLAPALILAVGALVGFMVIALLLPIFKMSQAMR